MSIWKGKLGYRTDETWPARTRRVLDGTAKPEERMLDLGLNEGPKQQVFNDEVRSKVALHKNPRILEIGSGYGIWAKHLRGMYQSFTGIDITKQRVDYANKNAESALVTFHHTEFAPQLPTAFFDVILSITCIQHVTMAEAVDILQLMDRCLASDGAIYLREGRIGRWTEEEAEAIYADPATAAHMIAKPICVFEDLVPGLVWHQESGTRFTLTKRK